MTGDGPDPGPANATTPAELCGAVTAGTVACVARMMGQSVAGVIVETKSGWVWRRQGHPDVPISHNRWARTSPEKDLPRLKDLLLTLDDLVSQARDALVAEYYDLWREAWRHGYERDLAEAEFAEKLVFQSVHYPSAQYLHSHFELAFDDGGLFAGHALSAVFKIDGTLVRVEMFG